MGFIDAAKVGSHCNLLKVIIKSMGTIWTQFENLVKNKEL